MLVRLSREEDLESIYQLSLLTGSGLTTLPPDRDKLSSRIRASMRSTSYPPDKPQGDSFLFVMENEEGRVIGTAAVYTKVGGFEPFWTYKIKKKRKHCEYLKIDREISYLQVKKEHDGPSEVGTLFLHPEFRGGSSGRLLSLSRFMFMACFPHIFEDQVVAELRGRITPEGNNPFWDLVVSHFFGISFVKADLMVNENKAFIDDLFPRHPLYIPLLPIEARQVIGQVHEDSYPAMRLLISEGFNKIDEVDIFEAGPVVSSKTSEIRTIKKSVKCQYEGTYQPGPADELSPLYIVSPCRQIKDFKAIATPLKLSESGFELPEEAAQKLQLNRGEDTRIVTLRRKVKR